MAWSDLFIVLFVSHVVGDFLLQTEWQAINKHTGLSGGEAGRALRSHLTTYSATFAPALVWVGIERGALGVLLTIVLALVTHFIQDDGRVLKAYVRRVKKTVAVAGSPLWMAIDQSAHLFFLFVAALVVGRLLT